MFDRAESYLKTLLVRSLFDAWDWSPILLFQQVAMVSTCGQGPLDETLQALYADDPNEAQVQMLNKSMENMVGVLGGYPGVFAFACSLGARRSEDEFSGY